MNWKEFLKPDWKKIVLTIIIGFITFLIFITSGSFYSPSPPPTIMDVVLLILAYPPLILFSIIPEGVSIPLFILNNILWISFIIELPYWYLISCFIVWFYNEKKKVSWKGFVKKHKLVSISIILIFSYIFYTSIYISFFYTPECISLEGCKKGACETFKKDNCSIDTSSVKINIDVNYDDKIDITDDNLQTFAIKYYGCKDNMEIANGTIISLNDCIKMICKC